MKPKRKKKISSTKKSKRIRSGEVLSAGFGGQGIMFMGKLLAQAGLLAGKNVTWMPSYGAEVRGGTAYSMTKISDREIASPIVTNPDALIVMNKPSLLKYSERVKEGGLLISNRSLIDNFKKRKNISLINLPLTEMASKLGDIKCANMIALGAFLKKTKMLSIKNAADALKDMLKGKEELFKINKKALEKGYNAVK